MESAFGPGAFDLIKDDAASSVDQTDEAMWHQPDRSPEDADDPVADDAPQPSRVSDAGRPHASPSERFLLFELEGKLFFIAVASVLEIQRAPDITPLPRVPSWLRGIANLRGTIISIVDLRRVLNLEPTDSERYMIVVRSLLAPVSAGLLVTRVLGFHAVSSDVASEGVTDGTDGHFVSRLEAYRGQSVAVLDVEKILFSNQICRPQADQA